MVAVLLSLALSGISWVRVALDMMLLNGMDGSDRIDRSDERIDDLSEMLRAIIVQRLIGV